MSEPTTAELQARIDVLETLVCTFLAYGPGGAQMLDWLRLNIGRTIPISERQGEANRAATALASKLAGRLEAVAAVRRSRATRAAEAPVESSEAQGHA